MCLLRRIQFAELHVDHTKHKTSVVLAHINPDNGTTAWGPLPDNAWSAESRAALQALIDCIEADAAAVYHGNSGLLGPPTPANTRGVEGLSEYADTTPDI